MEIILMVAIKRMHNFIHRFTLLFFVVIFCLASFSQPVLAVNYNSGLYNTGLYSATTPDTTPPVISLISAGTPNQTTATITWTTDEESDSQVEYGTSILYGDTTIIDTNLVTSHSVPLSGLTSSTVYHYRVISKDAVPNSSTSTDHTFTTNSIPDTNPPVRTLGLPTGVLSKSTSSTSLTLSTDEAATCKYSLSGGISYLSMVGVFNTTSGTSHSTVINNLSSGHSYNYYVRCIDGSNNTNDSDYVITFSIDKNVTSGSVVANYFLETSTFSLNLFQGVNNNEVKLLQKYLNNHGYIVAQSGSGSPGHETNIFGPATRSALIKFQKANNLTPDGVFGSKTRLFINNNL